MSVAIVESRECNIRDVLSRARMIDDVSDPEGQLRRWLQDSDQIWIGMYDDEVACLWGLNPLSAISDRAYLWLLTTDVVEKHKFVFIRRSQIFVDEALKQYEGGIYGHVKIDNERAKKWLKWLGAKFGNPSEGYMPFSIGRR